MNWESIHNGIRNSAIVLFVDYQVGTVWDSTEELNVKQIVHYNFME
jgi:hypothetical protein